jgi:hypothetical protein
MLSHETVSSHKTVRISSVPSEKEIRFALKGRCLRNHRVKTDVLMVEELGLAHARSRIDLAVFNGYLHGYEIKSAADTLYRLPSQLNIYQAALQKLTLVVATRHLEATIALVPDWCGLIEVVENQNGKLSLEPRRRSRVNPSIDPFMFAHLLWRSEAQDLLRAQGVASSKLEAPRKDLYQMLANQLSLRDLTVAIKLAMMSRSKWRDHP